MADPIFASGALPSMGLSITTESAVDIDRDGDLDVFSTDNNGNTLFSRNIGAVRSPMFAAPQTNPFGIVNMGSGAKGAFTDIDGDGDMDAFIGQYDGTMQFLRNIGTSANPQFAAAQANPFGLSTIASGAANPTFVDIDGDGDMDAFVGNYSGDTLFFRNTGTAQSPAFAAAMTNPFGFASMDFGSSTRIDPSFVDVDGDGDLDAFIGREHYTGSGNWFFRNIGTAKDPKFYSVGNRPFGIESLSTAFADIDGDGDQDQLVGNYKNMGEGISPFFSRIGPSLPDLDYFRDPTFVDIDGDGDLDAFAGMGYSYFHSNQGNTFFSEILEQPNKLYSAIPP